MPQPTYSLDLAPTDYYLFLSMVLFLSSCRFNDQEEVEASKKAFFTTKDNNWYQRGINEQAESWIHPVYNLDLAS